MNKIALIFPTQLFNNIKPLSDLNIIYLIEEPIYFTKYNFHKMKLAYHRATMKYYRDYLNGKGFTIKYIPFDKVNDNFYKNIKSENIVIYNPIEHILLEKLKKIYQVRLIILETQNFLMSDNEIDFCKKTIFKKSFNHRPFYIYQRKKLNILMKKDGENPVGDNWSYDENNREPLPDDIDIPDKLNIFDNHYTKEAISYINKHFNNNYGEINFIYPINYKDSIKHLDNFLKYKFDNFGKYQDAIHDSETFIFHSLLSPMMNVGILTDKIVVDRTLEYYSKNKIDIQNIEGFLRQIIGWRNYMYCIYMINKPILKISAPNKINIYHKLWLGKTDMYPIDNIIKNSILKYAYVHHIERLMVLGNFMKLCMLNTDLIYRMFMEWTIDSYEWVMYGNVYGMILNEVKIMKREYIASSNYINKMSNYKDNNNWNEIFDSIYYNYIKNIKQSYSLRYQISYYKKMSRVDKIKINNLAKNYLVKLNKKIL